MSFDRTWIAFGICSFVLAGCSSEDAAQQQKYLGLEPPSDRFQVRTLGARIEQNADVEYCEAALFPGRAGQTYYIGAMEYANAAHSHQSVSTGHESDRIPPCCCFSSLISDRRSHDHMQYRRVAPFIMK